MSRRPGPSSKTFVVPEVENVKGCSMTEDLMDLEPQLPRDVRTQRIQCLLYFY